MNHLIHTSIVNFIWGIADDVLSDVCVRGKYRDVILPMTVIRRLDALLEPSKEKVSAMKKQLDGAGIVNQHFALCQASGETFYDTSPFTLRDSEQVPLLKEGGPDCDGLDRPGQDTHRLRNLLLTRYFYKAVTMRTLAEIKADIYALEQETDGLLEQIVGEND